MSNYMVDVGLNVNPGQYMTTMGQAIEVTKQYSQVVDGVPGATSKMSAALVGLTNKVTGFNAVNTLAVDTAASYQKALSGIEAQATASGKSFSNLEKTTKQFGRNFSGGMGQAVQVVETLQKQGVKSEKQIETLGKAWIKLGAATGTSAAQIGSDFTQLSRTMGNGVANITKLSDSLVTTTAKIGGSADSVVAFSKALAPVAATVGMNQTAVMGLSAAMSSLGEDGYRSANVMNKVLLDMNRAVRDGGPELKAYADVMGSTADKVRELFKSNPTEFLTRFSESLGKAGPEMARQLEALGFDSVRDTRSLTALTRSGNLRSAIDTAQKSYGSGSTEAAAAKALEGVTDQAEKLKESMSQIVANAGKPLLGVAQGQLGLANKVAGGLASFSEGEIPQALSGVAGVGGAIGSVGMNALTLASVIALTKIGMRKIGESDFAQEGGRAFRAGMNGESVARAGTMTGRMGQAIGGGIGSTFMVPNGEPVSWSDRAMAATRGTARVGADLAARGLRGIYDNTLRMGEGLPPIRSAGGEMYREQLSEARGMLRSGRIGGAAMESLRATGQYLGGIGQPGSSMSLTQAIGSTALGTARTLGGAAGAVGMGALRGGMAFAGSPVGMAVIGAGGLMALNSRGQEANQRAYDIRSSGSDMYSAYNAFAEAAGLATKGLTSFSTNVATTAKVLTSQNTTMQKALSITGEEVGNATAAGYAPAYKLQGDDRSVMGIAAQGQGLLGARPSAEAVSAFLSDVVNQAGEQTAKGVAAQFQNTYGGSGPAKFDYSAMAKTLVANNPGGGAFWEIAGGLNDTQKQLATQNAQAVMGLATMDRQAFGGTVKVQAGYKTVETDIGTARVAAEAEKLYNAAQKAGAGQGSSPQERQASAAAVNAQIQSLLGADFEKYGFSLDGAPSSMGLQTGASFQELIEGAAKGGNTTAQTILGLKSSGAITSSGDVNVAAFKGEASENEKASRKLDQEFASLAKTSVGLSDSLYGAEKAARDAGKTLDDLYRTGGSGTSQSSASKDVFGYEMGGTETQKRRGAEALLADALKRSGGSQGLAAASLQIQATQAGTDSRKQEEIALALQLQQPRAALANAGRSAAAERIAGMTASRAVGGLQFSASDSVLNDQISAAQDQTYNIGAQAIQAAVGFNQGYGSLQTSIAQVQRSSGINAGSIQRDTALGEQYAREDFARQRRLGRRDFNISVNRANRDFGIQETRAVAGVDRQERYAREDQMLQESRSKRDFDKQMLHAEEDFQKSRARAVEDYNTQIYRAQRDFDKQMGRAQRDFDKSQMRGMEDFDRGRLRAQEDFSKQMSRMVEDSAKQMYDPWKRISAQMVMDAGQLVTNLKDQTAAIDKQVQNLAEARSMGLSDAAIKALNLADASNAQQLSRIVQDLRGNTDYAGEINSAVSAKASSAGTLATDMGNTAYARTQEDFDTQMKRMQEDYNISAERAKSDFATSKADTSADFATSMADSAADFNKSIARMDADYAVSVKRAQDSFDVSLKDSRQSFDISRVRGREMLAEQLQYAKEDHDRALSDMKRDFDKANNDAKDSLDISITRMWEKARNAMSDVGAQAAAQIQSMMEGFFKVGQNSPTGEAAFKTTLQNVMSSGIEPSKMGQEIQDQIQEALNYVTTNNIKVPQNLTDWFSKRGFVGKKDAQLSRPDGGFGDIGGTFTEPYNVKASAAGTYTKSYDKKAFADMAGDPVEAFVQIGKAAWDGFMKGFSGSKDAGFGIIQNIFMGLVGAVKGWLGIHSPSTVFAEIGKNVVEGLKNGIVDTIGGVWENITSPIASLDIKGKVTDAFDAAKTWLGNLGGTVTTWISDGWDSLWKKLTSVDIGSKVSTAFDTVKTWLGTLGTTLTTWVGSGWEALWEKLPTPGEMLGKVKDIFISGKENVSTWLSGMADWITGKMPSVDKFMAAFGAIKDGLEGVLHNIVENWNKLDLELNITIPAINNIGKFAGWSAKTQNVGGKEVTIVPGFGGWDGFSIPETKVKTGDLIPDFEKNPFKAFALGGIATQQTHALIGEAGYPEAVIPLNQRGAEVLAATMARYIGKGEAQGAMVGQYATPVVNNYSSQNYDQSTQFNGPITVQAQSPDEMAQALQARARRRALSQPIQGRR